MSIELIAKCDNCGHEELGVWDAEDILKFRCDECGEEYCTQCREERHNCLGCQQTLCDDCMGDGEVCLDCKENVDTEKEE